MRFPTMWCVRPAKARDQPARTRSLIRAFANLLNILPTEHHLDFLSLKGFTLVKMPHCWKSHVAAHIYLRIVTAVPIVE